MYALLAGYARRARWAVPFTAAVFAVDQGTKLAATAVHPSTFVLNGRQPSLWGTVAIVVTMVVVLGLPFTPATLASAVWAGGAAGNLLDAYFWPGGVPDFIRAAPFAGTWNLADAFIAAGVAGLGLALILWVAVAPWRLSRLSAHARAQVAD